MQKGAVRYSRSKWLRQWFGSGDCETMFAKALRWQPFGIRRFVYTANKLSSETGARRAIILISDRLDTGSRSFFNDAAQALHMLGSSDVCAEHQRPGAIAESRFFLAR